MTTFRLRVRQQGRLTNLRGIEVESIEQSAIVSRVPGSRLGMALVHGQIIPVLRLGDEDGCLVVGRVQGEVFGVIGLHIVGLEPEEPGAEPSTLAAEMDSAVAGDWPLPYGDSSPSADSELELDVGALIATAKLRQQRAVQSSEETP
jgi:hypothetical protein